MNFVFENCLSTFSMLSKYKECKYILLWNYLTNKYMLHSRYRFLTTNSKMPLNSYLLFNLKMKRVEKFEWKIIYNDLIGN